MRKFFFFGLILLFVMGCGIPQETRRGVGSEGFLIIQANPDDAEVYVNGEKVGLASQFEKKPLELRSGPHKIEFRKAGFIAEIREVYVGNQSRHTLKVSLRKIP
ncbi:MAG: PEGA domain-containing protein [Deltaproteobacteria bacterium]|nr:PEGA domain-containing protein [Deltaproteobacteria bacterium]